MTRTVTPGTTQRLGTLSGGWRRRVFLARALALARCRGGLEHPGAKLNSGPLFRVPIVASAGHPLSATALGTAEGAFEHVLNAFKTRMGTYTGAKVADFQAVQVKLARARCLIDSARHLMRESARMFQENDSLDLETKLRLRAQNAFASSSMSPRRSRSGGPWIVMTLIR